MIPKTVPKTKRLHITMEDIFNGKRFSPSSCPTALSGQREFGTDEVSVGLSSLSVWIENRHYDYLLPRPLMDWILSFDKSGKYSVKPIECEIWLSPRKL